MLRALFVASALALSACTVPRAHYVTESSGDVELAVSPSDTSAVRQLCVDPEGVLAGKRSCVLKRGGE